MNKNTKLVVAILLLAVGAALLIGYGTRPKGPKPPDEVLGKKIDKIDEKTLKIYSLTAGEWMALGQQKGRYRNPETKEYTITPIMTCSECGEDIPAPVIDEASLDKPPGIAMAEAMKSVKCPHCGKTPILGKRPPPKKGKTEAPAQRP